MPEVSFIIVAHNEEKTISRCLSSILKQENIGEYEIIVVDDGSTDNTASVVQGVMENNSKIILKRLITNQGRGAARREGANLARGKYFAYIDSDIVLPENWLSTCIKYMTEYDAVGGVAVPDGDVNYVYALLNIKPKVVSPTTVVSGSNGLYKSEIFKKINFGRNFKDGEDSVFNKRMVEEGYKTFSIQSLLVEHREARGYFKSLKWLYQTGRGATRQFKQYRDFRLPDIAYFLIVALTVSSIVASVISNNYIFLFLPFILVLVVDVVHFNNKFFFEFSYIHKYIFGVLIYWSMLVSYFFGRTAGWFVAVPKDNIKKRVMVCFDFEGEWGMPFKEEYDIRPVTTSILSTLKNHDVKAVFFTVGKIIEENPELIRSVHNAGHEIALHGYAHEHLDRYSDEELKVFGGNLSRIEGRLLNITGKQPTAFRSPYLMGPAFYSEGLYKILKDHGYKWVSNREVRYPEEMFRPDRLSLFRREKFCGFFYNVMLFLLNIKTVFTDNTDESRGFARIKSNIKWLFNGAVPFKRYDLLEVPLHSPMDCDLLGLPSLEDYTSKKFIDFAISTITNGINNRGGELYTITLHDWIIGSGNRIELLDNILSKLKNNENIVFVTDPII